MIKQRLREELCMRLKKVWSSELSAREKVELTNTWATAIYIYILPLWKWEKREMMELDRKIMLLNKATYYGASVERSHIPWKLGGRGIVSFLEMYQSSEVQTASYIINTKDDEVIDVVKH